MRRLKSEQAKLNVGVRHLRGQMEAIERKLENEASCGEIRQLVASIRRAINGQRGARRHGSL